MKRLSGFLIGVVVGGGLVFGAQRYHVLRTEQGFEVVPKLSADFSETSPLAGSTSSVSAGTICVRPDPSALKSGSVQSNASQGVGELPPRAKARGCTIQISRSIQRPVSDSPPRTKPRSSPFSSHSPITSSSDRGRTTR